MTTEGTHGGVKVLAPAIDQETSVTIEWDCLNHTWWCDWNGEVQHRPEPLQVLSFGTFQGREVEEVCDHHNDTFPRLPCARIHT